MSAMPDLNLTLDFGQVGYHNSKGAFRVTLSADALEALIQDARRGWRVYELALIERPGDVWEYVHVTPVAVPLSLRECIDAAHAAAKKRFSAEHPWPEGQVPFADFDGFFQPVWVWDLTPLDEEWRGRSLDGYAQQLFAVARDALACLGGRRSADGVRVAADPGSSACAGFAIARRCA